MFEDKFGNFPRKKVSFNGEAITINKEVIPVDSVKIIYFRPYNLLKNQWGSLYFSEKGEDKKEAGFNKARYFEFTNRQTDKVQELLDLIDIEVEDK